MGSDVAGAAELHLPHAESGDVKATIAVLGFILSSAAKHGVDSESLSSELQQLGLPKGRGDPGGVTTMGLVPSDSFVVPWQNTPAGCAGPMRRSRAPSRTA